MQTFEERPVAVPPLRYSIDAAAAALGISRPTLYRRIREGAIKVTKDGSRTFVSPQELARYAKESR